MEDAGSAPVTEEVLEKLEGKEYLGEYLAKTDAMGSSLKHPVSHVAYGYATQVCILDEDGYIRKITAAHDVGKAVNPLSVEGQIEGGVIMSFGYATTERYPITDSVWFYKEKQRVRRACTRPICCSLYYSVLFCHKFSHQLRAETEALQKSITLGQRDQLTVSLRKL